MKSLQYNNRETVITEPDLMVDISASHDHPPRRKMCFGLHPTVVAAVVVIMYLSLAGVGGYFSYKYFNNTKTVFTPKDDSLVGKSKIVAAEYLRHGQVYLNPLLVLVQSANPLSSVLENEELKNFTRALLEATETGPLRHVARSFRGYFSLPSYVQSTEMGSHLVGGPHNDTTTMQMELVTDSSRSISVIEAWMESYIQALFPPGQPPTFSVETTSVSEIFKDLQEGIISDLVKVDAVCLPLALMAFIFCIMSLRLLVIPGLAIPVTIFIGFGLMYPVTTTMSVSSLAPEMSIAVMLAISVDYSLFMSTRFKEESSRQQRSGDNSNEAKFEAVWLTTIHTAHNVVVSGLAIVVALAGIAALPVDLLSPIGIAFCIGASCAVVVSMTLTPAVLYLGYDLLAQQSIVERCWAAVVDRCRKRSTKDPATGFYIPADETEGLLEGKSEEERHQYLARRDQYESLWFRMGVASVDHPFIVLLVVFACGAPFIYFCSEMMVDFALFSQVPRNSVHAEVLRKAADQVGEGTAFPFYVILEAANPGGVLTDGFFQAANDLITMLKYEVRLPLTGVTSFAYIGAPISNLVAQLLLSDTSENNTLALQYQYLFNQTVDRSNTIGLIQLSTPFDPFGHEADAFLTSLKPVLENVQQVSESVKFAGVLGASSDSWQIMHTVLDLFGPLIAITFSVIFAVIGLVFRSVFIPLRMIITVGYTVAVAFGAGTTVFQYTWLHPLWTGMDGVQAYSWTVPIFCFSLLSALALDYDIFLLTRIAEFRSKGYKDRAAVIKGVYMTGRIISFAGIVMAVSFGGLMFTNVVLLNQFGFVSLVAVLVDTFVVRPFMVPALMSVLPSAVWWPRKFERADRDLDDMEH